jgi:hypothetical protein
MATLLRFFKGPVYEYPILKNEWPARFSCLLAELELGLIQTQMAQKQMVETGRPCII